MQENTVWKNFERQFSVAGDNARGLLDAGVANDPRARLATGVDHHHLELMLGRDIVAQQVFASGEIHFRIHDDGDAPGARARVEQLSAVSRPGKFMVQGIRWLLVIPR